MRENIFQIVIGGLLAALGSMARQLNRMNKEPLRPVTFISGSFIAAFTGVIFYFIAEYFQINGSLVYAAAGICGWVGPSVLDSLAKKVFKMAGIDINNEKDE